MNKQPLTRWRSLFLSAGICGLFISRLSAQPTASSPQPPHPGLPAVIAEQAALDFVNAVLLFDHLAMRSATVTSPDYLTRVSEPSSKFRESYLAYQQGHISRAELVRRLPHIAMVGDSLSKNFYISSPASMLWRARTEQRKDWFLDNDPSPSSVDSLFERLEAVTPLVATEYSRSGASVAPPHVPEAFSRRLARTRNLEGQIKEVSQAKRFPDVILLWIGHNNTEWVPSLSESERRAPEKYLHEIAQQFESNYAAELRPLLDRAKTQDHRVAIVVFGLADFRSFFKSRRKAAALHADNPKLYPYYEASCRYFEALQPAYQSGTTHLGLMMNDELRRMVATLNRESRSGANVRLQYSDAFAKIDLGQLERLHRMDAWHPSVIGHDVLAEAAFKAIVPSLEFVGIGEQSRVSRGDHVAHHLAR
jgi:lysophospholipase L1-like esterase